MPRAGTRAIVSVILIIGPGVGPGGLQGVRYRPGAAQPMLGMALDLHSSSSHESMIAFILEPFQAFLQLVVPLYPAPQRHMPLPGVVWSVDLGLLQ